MEKESDLHRLKELEKLLIDKGYEDSLRKAKFQSILEMLEQGKFRVCDALVLAVLLDEEDINYYLAKCHSYVKCAKDVLDEVSIKDLRNKLLEMNTKKDE